MKDVSDKMVGMFKGWVNRVKHGAVDWDELEATLIQCDLGLPLTEKILNHLKSDHLSSATVQEATVNEISGLWEEEARSLDDLSSNLEVWLIVGVNGVGKTTSIAKLANRYQNQGRKVHLVAADTFRAAAIEQLKIWADRLNTTITCGMEGGDPGAAVFQGMKDAKDVGANLVLIDTAGRLHNKDNLMRELEKVKRIIHKQDEEAPHETLIVVDAGNGTNSLEQARKFHNGVELTGVIVTKLDSSAKGGVVAAIKEELDLDVVMVGVGEAMEDLIPFEKQRYVEKFFG